MLYYKILSYLSLFIYYYILKRGNYTNSIITMFWNLTDADYIHEILLYEHQIKGGKYLSTRHTTVGKTFLILNKFVKLYIKYKISFALMS